MREHDGVEWGWPPLDRPALRRDRFLARMELALPAELWIVVSKPDGTVLHEGMSREPTIRV